VEITGAASEKFSPEKIIPLRVPLKTSMTGSLTGGDPIKHGAENG